MKWSWMSVPKLKKTITNQTKTGNLRLTKVDTRHKKANHNGGKMKMNLKLTKNREVLKVEDDFRITNIGKTIKAIIAEYNCTIMKNAPFNSTYEGWALIKEKIDGLWEEIRKDESGYSKEASMKVAAQIGAMAMRFMVDLGAEEEPVQMNHRVGSRKSNYSHFI